MDNEQRKDKSIAGSIEKLRQGYWVGKAPKGFDQITIKGEQKITVNTTGQLIRKVFIWKANEGLSNIDIIKRLQSLGLKLYMQDLTKIFRNPFYCGIICHKYLEGDVLEGKHEKLISQEIFLKVNEIQSKTAYKYVHAKKNDKLPLRKYVLCSKCNTPFTGYFNKKKSIYYYKCNRIGCKCNKNAQQMHELYINLLSAYSINELFLDPLKLQLGRTFDYLNRQNEITRKELILSLKEKKTSIDKIEERFVLGEINKELFEKYSERIKADILSIEEQLNKVSLKLSNHQKYINYTISISSKLNKIWELADFDRKIKFQYLLFPNGISYDKENHTYRTTKINNVFSYISDISKEMEKKKMGQSDMKSTLSHYGWKMGLEPTTLRTTI